MVSELPDLVDFLHRVVRSGEPAVLPIVTTILRRIPLSAPIVKRIGRSGLLADFMKEDKKISGTSLSEGLLLFIGTIGEFAYAEECVPVCPAIAQRIVTGGALSMVAGQVAVTLCRSKKCRAEFRAQRLPSFYRKRVDDPSIGKQAQQFLEAVQDQADDDDGDYYES